MPTKERQHNTTWRAIRRWLISVRSAGLIFILVGLATATGGSLYDSLSAREAIQAFYANASTELIGIGLTVIIIDWLYERQDEKRERRRLVNQLYSPVPGMAAEAVRLLHLYGWYEDELVADALGNAAGDFSMTVLAGIEIVGQKIMAAPKLNGAILIDANLEGTRFLAGANLEKAILQRANLKHVSIADGVFKDARLENANLEKANLAGCIFDDASLQDASLKSAAMVFTSLVRTNLSGANLEGAAIWDANLEKVNLERANLTAASLRGANLKRARLGGSTMKDANLSNAILELANLAGANFEGADLRGAEMLGAVLSSDVLRGGHIVESSFDKASLLPDGRSWTVVTDMTRFTDPDHPEFWRSDDPNSPAYRSDDGSNNGNAVGSDG